MVARGGVRALCVLLLVLLVLYVLSFLLVWMILRAWLGVGAPFRSWACFRDEYLMSCLFLGVLRNLYTSALLRSLRKLQLLGSQSIVLPVGCLISSLGFAGL